MNLVKKINSFLENHWINDAKKGRAENAFYGAWNKFYDVFFVWKKHNIPLKNITSFKKSDY